MPRPITVICSACPLGSASRRIRRRSYSISFSGPVVALWDWYITTHCCFLKFARRQFCCSIKYAGYFFTSEVTTNLPSKNTASYFAHSVHPAHIVTAHSSEGLLSQRWIVEAALVSMMQEQADVFTLEQADSVAHTSGNGSLTRRWWCPTREHRSVEVVRNVLQLLRRHHLLGVNIGVEEHREHRWHLRGMFLLEPIDSCANTLYP